MYSNVDGLTSKRLELKDTIQEKNPDIICITETKLIPETTIEALGINDYNIWRRERTEKGGGGVMIMAKKDIAAVEIEQRATTFAELIALEIRTKSKGIIVATSYIAPKSDVWSKEDHKQLTQESHTVLSDLLHKMENKSQDIILTGDFNCEINWETLEAKSHPNNWNENLLDLITDHCLHQHVNKPTRRRGTDKPSMLDLIFTRQPEDITN